MELLDRMVFGNSLQLWVISLTAWLIGFFLLRFAIGVAGRRLQQLAARTRTPWDDILSSTLGRTRSLFLLLLSLYLASRLLVLPARVDAILGGVMMIGLLLQGAIWISAFIQSTLELYRQQAMEKNPAAVTTIGIVGFISRFVIWSTVVLVALDHFGVDVTALVAGLGIGGVAVALAVQNILGDLFASLSIMLDKPFVVGDFLIVGEFMGGVEHIGLKTTRIRSLSGEQLVFSNSDLLNSRIRNYGRMFQRRVSFTLGVTYETPRAQLRRIPEIIREAVQAQSATRFDRSHFMRYGAYSLDFETVYFVLSADYNQYMDVQQAIYLQIHERFEEEGIAFAYPTQKIYFGAAVNDLPPVGQAPAAGAPQPTD